MKRFKYIIVGRKVWVATLLAAATLVTGSITAYGWNKTLTTTGETKRLPIYCTEQQDKKVSLTFDAAWGNTI